MAESEEKLALAAQLERSRAKIARHVTAVRQDLDVPKHLKRSFTDHKPAYIGGAALVGLLLSKLPPRKKKVYVDKKEKGAVKDVKEVEKAGFWIIVLQFLFSALKPALTSLLANQVTNFVKSKARSEG
jgi:hypothetical protein